MTCRSRRLPRGDRQSEYTHMVTSRWRRVNRQQPCPICRKPDWCLVAADGDAAICARVASDRRAGQAGYLHRLRQGASGPQPREVTIAADRSRGPDHSAFADQCQKTAKSAGAIEHASRRLGVTPESLRRFRVGWWIEQNCWTWPMTDASGTRIIGITRRFLDDSKKCVGGHRAGLYLPTDLPQDMSALTLLVVEGGSDAAAGLDLDYWTVGRFSCQHGRDLIRRLLRHRQPARVAICADTGNIHERRGAQNLARDLLPYSRELRLIAPPAPHRDLRAWLRAGATHADLRHAIETAPVRRLRVSAK